MPRLTIISWLTSPNGLGGRSKKPRYRVLSLYDPHGDTKVTEYYNFKIVALLRYNELLCDPAVNTVIVNDDRRHKLLRYSL